MLLKPGLSANWGEGISPNKHKTHFGHTKENKNKKTTTEYCVSSPGQFGAFQQNEC